MIARNIFPRFDRLNFARETKKRRKKIKNKEVIDNEKKQNVL